MGLCISSQRIVPTAEGIAQEIEEELRKLNEFRKSIKKMSNIDGTRLVNVFKVWPTKQLLEVKVRLDEIENRIISTACSIESHIELAATLGMKHLKFSALFPVAGSEEETILTFEGSPGDLLKGPDCIVNRLTGTGFLSWLIDTPPRIESQDSIHNDMPMNMPSKRRAEHKSRAEKNRTIDFKQSNASASKQDGVVGDVACG